MSEVEEKCGTVEDLIQDLHTCGFYPTEDLPLEAVMADTRIKIDNAMQELLSQSKLPLFLFDYLVTSVLADIRKADLDLARSALIATVNPEESEEDNGDTQPTRT